jgi:hypothetical protein
MIMSVILSAFYVTIDVINWFVRLTQDPRRVTVIRYSTDAWFFYLITTFQGKCKVHLTQNLMLGFFIPRLLLPLPEWAALLLYCFSSPKQG